MSDYSRLSPRSTWSDGDFGLYGAAPRTPRRRSSVDLRRVQIQTPRRSLTPVAPALLPIPATPTPRRGHSAGASPRNWRQPDISRQLVPYDPARASRRRTGSADSARARNRELTVPNFDPQIVARSPRRESGVLTPRGGALSVPPLQRGTLVPRSSTPPPTGSAPNAVISVSGYRRMVPKPIRAEREQGVVTVGEVRVRRDIINYVAPQHVERQPFLEKRLDPVKPRRSLSIGWRRKGTRSASRGCGLCNAIVRKIKGGWRWLQGTEKRKRRKSTRHEAWLAGKISGLPLPTAAKRGLFDTVVFVEDFFTSRLVLFVILLLGLLTAWYQCVYVRYPQGLRFIRENVPSLSSSTSSINAKV